MDGLASLVASVAWMDLSMVLALETTSKTALLVTRKRHHFLARGVVRHSDMAAAAVTKRMKSRTTVAQSGLLSSLKSMTKTERRRRLDRCAKLVQQRGEYSRVERAHDYADALDLHGLRGAAPGCWHQLKLKDVDPRELENIRRSICRLLKGERLKPTLQPRLELLMKAAIAADPEAGYNDRMAIQMLHFLRVFDFGDEFAFFAFQAASRSPLLSLRLLYMDRDFHCNLCRDFEELLRTWLPDLVRKLSTDWGGESVWVDMVCSFLFITLPFGYHNSGLPADFRAAVPDAFIHHGWPFLLNLLLEMHRHYSPVLMRDLNLCIGRTVTRDRTFGLEEASPSTRLALISAAIAGPLTRENYDPVAALEMEQRQLADPGSEPRMKTTHLQ